MGAWKCRELQTPGPRPESLMRPPGAFVDASGTQDGNVGPSIGFAYAVSSFKRPVLSPSLSMGESMRSKSESQRLLSGVSFS